MSFLDQIFQKIDVKPLHFGRKVGASSSGTERYNVKKNGTIEKIAIRIYSGAEDTLQLNVFKDNDEVDNLQKIIETPDDQNFIGGNEDFFTFEISEEVTQEDEIVVEYDNTDGSNPHRYKINMEIDRTGGILSNIFR